MMDGKEPSADRTRWLELYLVLLADHGLNASTFAARVIAPEADAGAAFVFSGQVLVPPQGLNQSDAGRRAETDRGRSRAGGPFHRSERSHS